MAAKAAMARRKQRILEKKAQEEAEAVAKLNVEPTTSESKEDETNEKRGGSDVLDDILDDVFDNGSAKTGVAVDDYSVEVTTEGVSSIKISEDTPVEDGGSGEAEDDGEPVLPSEASAAAAEEAKEKNAENKMKAYRMKRFKKKEKALKGDATKEAIKDVATGDADDVAPTTSPSSTLPSLTPSNEEVEPSQPKKKFQGIAKVRRRKIREEQKKEEQRKTEMEEWEEGGEVEVKMKERSSSHKTLELLIIVFFLSVGYLIGYNSIANPPTDILIAGMDGAVDMGNDMGETDDVDLMEIKKLKEELMSSDDALLPSLDSTLDPVFGMDFDLMLMEDNLLNSIGRVAVGAHRMATRVAKLPYDLFVPKTWPIFCMISLTVRAATFTVFGATGQPSNDAKKDKGIMEMAVGFARDMFPRMFMCWELYQLVIGDVLLLFTGLLLAMATTRIGGGEVGEASGMASEL